jgi:alpha-1,3-mannosyltransferase
LTNSTLFCFLVKPDNIYISIYESNSSDGTQELLKAFALVLAARGVRHRIICGSEKRQWGELNSVERIQFLKGVRNKALEPLASLDPLVRLDDAQRWQSGRTLFLNDILFDWKDAVKLLNDRTDDGHEFDMICGIDYGPVGELQTKSSTIFCV